MIRVIRVEDWELLKSLRELLYEYLEREESVDENETRLEIEKSNAYGEFQSGDLRGYIIVKSTTDTDQNFPDALNINEIYVKDEYRKQGIGTSLINSILDSEIAGDYDRIFVTYTEGNNSIKSFYSKLGFVEYKKLDSGEYSLVKYLVKLNI